MGAGDTDPPTSRDDFRIALIAALRLERNALEAMLDQDYTNEGMDFGQSKKDLNTYRFGRIGRHYVVIPYPRVGTLSISEAAGDMRWSFSGIDLALIVGVLGGAPFTTPNSAGSRSRIYLGDVIISTQVVQYDFARRYDNTMSIKRDVEDVLARPDRSLSGFLLQLGGNTASGNLRRGTISCFQACRQFSTHTYAYPGVSNDRLFASDYRHKHRRQAPICQQCNECTDWYHPACDSAREASCDELGCDESSCDKRADLNAGVEAVNIFFGRVGCANQVLRGSHTRDGLLHSEKIIGFEQEAAGSWDKFPTIVIKGVADYADSHKNKEWQPYSAAMAASCAKALLQMPATSALLSAEKNMSGILYAIPTLNPRASPIKLFYELHNGEEHISRRNPLNYWQYLTRSSYEIYLKIAKDAQIRSNHPARKVYLSVLLQNFDRRGPPPDHIADVWTRLLRVGVEVKDSRQPIHYVVAVLYMLHIEKYLRDERPTDLQDPENRRRKALQGFVRWVPCRCKPGCCNHWNFTNDRGICDETKPTRCRVLKLFTTKDRNEDALKELARLRQLWNGGSGIER